MELKKSKDADLEQKRIVFGSVGLVMVSALVLMAFTIETVTPAEKIAQVEEKKKTDDELIFEMPPEQAPPPEQQESAPPPPTLEVVEVVEDDEEIEELDLTAFEEEVDPLDNQEEEEVEIEAEPIVDFAEVEPAFPGGEVEMIRFIQQNVEYPELSREMGEQGTVYVQFVVNSDGSIQDVVVLKGVSELLDKEAVRVVKKMPAWSPGEQAGKKIRVRYQIPIKFSIA
ncbi:MAG: energy transducer TonB [Bacteroidetes bacterium]|nr:energy transducer TonB [Bacteroidota bacterium]